MFLLIQLIILFCSFAQAEYVLYKYDGTELSVQEHRQAYQILLEQQWPTAPAFNSNYNPEIDEEVEIAKRLKAEVPTVYARWIPKVVYERVLYEIMKTDKPDDKSLIDHNQFIVSNDQIIELGKGINTLPHFIAFHKKTNKFLQIALNAVSLDNEDGALIRYYYKIMTGKSIGETMLSIVDKGVIDDIDHINHISFKILLLEERFKAEPNMFLLFRAGHFLPYRDFSISQLQNFKNDLSAAYVNELRKIKPDHLHNISYGASFFAAQETDPGAASSAYYFDQTSRFQYGYVLPLKKTDILNNIQFFGIPPLTTLINSFFCSGELFHPRAFTLITDDLQASQDIENGLHTIMSEHSYSEEVKGNDTWYNYWIKDETLSQLLFKLDSTQEVIKQAALRRRYIVQNAIPLNDATKKLIDDARKIYK